MKKITLNVMLITSLLLAGRLFASGLSVPASLDFSQISLFAAFSHSAYLQEEEVRRLPALDRYTFSHFDNIPELQVSYYLANNDDEQIQVVVVRGTANVENAMLDLSFKLNPDEQTGVALHQGFLQAATAIYKRIKPYLKQGYRIHATGHSMGGAVALILGMKMSIDGFKPGKIVTFGQPKVTNFSGAQKFQKLDVTRVVTRDDLVPLLPPVEVSDLSKLDIFWHLGREVILLEENNYAILTGIDCMLRASNFTQSVPGANNLNEHGMAVYEEMVNKRVFRSAKVPFKIDLNLFNLF